MTKIYLSFTTAAAFLLTSCGIAITTGNNSSAAKPKSKIVEQVEAAGSGPVEHASKEALFYWFRDRIPLTLAINKQCKEIRATAPATWEDTPEGRVCAVTRDIAATRGE